MSLTADHKPAQDIFVWTALRRSVTRFNVAMTLLAIGLFFFDLAFTRKLKLDGLFQLVSGWPTLLIVIGALLLCHWRPLPRLIHSCENAIWAVALTSLLSVVIQIAARSPRPLVDLQLTHIDHLLNVNTASVASASAHIPLLHSLFALTYDLVPLLIMLALMLPPFTDRPEASRRYLIALVIATFMTATLFAFWPAAGPWATESFAPSDLQLRVTKYLAMLKSPARVTLDFDTAAIVSFPSFHVVLAILSATALGTIPRARIAVWIYASLTCLSTLTTGWHYGVDLLGGLAVAVSAQLCAKWICPYLEGANEGSSSANAGKIRDTDQTPFKRAA